MDILIEKIQSHFANHRNSELLFFDILNYSIDKLDKVFDIDDFKEYMFCDNNELKKIRKEVIDTLQTQNFLILHGYSKNGKSTNVKILAEEYIDWDLKIIDFEHYAFKYANNNTFTFKKSTIDFLISGIKNKLFHHKDIFVIINYFQNIEEHNNFEKKNQYHSEVLDLFSEISEDILKFYNDGYNELDSNITIEFLENYKDHSNVKGATQLLLLYIILTTNSQNQNKTIFIFDNIDTLLARYEVDTATNHITMLASKFTVLKNSYSIIKDIVNDLILDNLKFIYTYRTANYLNILRASQTQGGTEAIKEKLKFNFETTYSISINSNKFVTDIIDKRLAFYKEVCEKLGLHKCSTYFILDKLIEIDKDSKTTELTLNKFFSIYNNNKNVILKPAYIKIDSRAVESIYKKLYKRRYDYLFRGAYFFYLIKPLVDNSLSVRSTRKISGTSKKLLKLLFTSMHEDDKCSLRRLLINFIIAKSISSANLELNSSSESITDSIDKNSVSLFTIFEFFRKSFISEDNELYTSSEVCELLNELFPVNVDSWGHFFISVWDCEYTTKTEESSGIFSNRRVNFNRELQFYQKYVETKKESYREHLENIYFLYNQNAIYYVKYLCSHFEYFGLNQDPKRIQDEPLLEKVGAIIDFTNKRNTIFDFEIYINNTISTIINCSETTVNYYIDQISPYKNLTLFIEEPVVLDKKLYFQDLLSRAITHVDQFRLFYLENFEYFLKNGFFSLSKSGIEIYEMNANDIFDYKLIVNERILQELARLTNHFILLSNMLKNQSELHKTLISARISFKNLKQKLDDWENDGFTNFTDKLH